MLEPGRQEDRDLVQKQVQTPPHHRRFALAFALRPAEQAKKKGVQPPPKKALSVNGAKRIRTADPLHAMQVLYQLSYGPF